ncbi:MAG: phage tail assembly chaperone [Candidatus Accumulibacter propinquus]|jgi:hypothetical protein|uniref:phage tail assembly chaperone n=1 Tax=Candidatus Accumulibacter propinquus TaxID=2954380 RepID=UPI002FC2E0A6
MFKLEPNPTFWATVEIHVPGQGKGRLEVEFRYLDRVARQTYFESLTGKTNLDALTEIVVDWREIDAPFTADNLGRLLDAYAGAAMALYDAYVKEISGAAEKN